MTGSDTRDQNASELLGLYHGNQEGHGQVFFALTLVEGAMAIVLPWLIFSSLQTALEMVITPGWHSRQMCCVFLQCSAFFGLIEASASKLHKVVRMPHSWIAYG